MDSTDVPFECKFAADGAAERGTFEGHAAVFGNIDDGGDRIVAGACVDTIARHKGAGTMPKMLLNHGGFGGPLKPSPLDQMPVGKWLDIAEDSKGLLMRGRLINLDTEDGKKIYGAMREGELSDLSIMYKATKFVRGARAGEPKRTISALDLFEAGPVTFGMNKLAKVLAVKSGAASEIDDINSLSDAEAFLREAGGPWWSKKMATDFVGRLVKIARREAGDDQGMNGLLEQLRSTRRLIVPTP